MSIDEWMERFYWALGDVFTGSGRTTSYTRKAASLVSESPPPVGAYMARPGDWWVYS